MGGRESDAGLLGFVRYVLDCQLVEVPNTEPVVFELFVENCAKTLACRSSGIGGPPIIVRHRCRLLKLFWCYLTEPRVHLQTLSIADCKNFVKARLRRLIEIRHRGRPEA